MPGVCVSFFEGWVNEDETLRSPDFWELTLTYSFLVVGDTDGSVCNIAEDCGGMVSTQHFERGDQCRLGNGASN